MSPETGFIGYCRICGKELQESGATTVNGALYCPEHAPTPGAGQGGSSQVYNQPYTHSQAGSPYSTAQPPPLHQETPFQAGSPYGTAQPPPLPQHNHSVSPVVAFVLGFIPGVGAVYNGQYAKGLVHVVIFGTIISILSSGAARGFEPLFGIMIPTFLLYMAFEAYHTAKKLHGGEMVDEFSGLMGTGRARSRFPVAPVLLIAFGVLFLLDNFDLLRIGRLLRYWPGLLIALGVYLLYERIAESKTETKYEPK